MQQTLTHQTRDFLAPTMAKTITPLIGVIGKMASLWIILLEEEEAIKAILAKGTQEEKQNKICTHCGLNNHTIDECYRKHGYPPRHRLYKSQSSNINSVNAMKEESDTSTLNQNQDAQSEDVRLTP